MENSLDSASALLLQLQSSLASRDDSHGFIDESEKLLFCPVGDALHIEFYGLTFGPFFEKFLETLCVPAVAACVGALVFDGPDEGANGVRDWEFSPFLRRQVNFPRLQTLEIVPSTPDQHNLTVIGESYEEDGQIARLMGHAPALRGCARIE